MLKGKFIGVEESATSFVLERKFSVTNPSVAVLRATAPGLYYAEINGVRVGDCFLTPGWTSYNKMLQVQEYDVTSLIKQGENVIRITVGEGWYCGPLSWMMKQNVYGDKIAVCADLGFDDKVLSTDESWTAKTSRIISNGIYDGEEVDLTATQKSLTAIVVPFDKSHLVTQISEPVRTTERLKVKEIVRTPKGDLIYDFGQNISGVVEITTRENFDGTLTMQHAELMVDGEFYTGNLGNAKATDKITCKGKKTYAPEFTFHGFRYMKLEGAELPAENVTALVRHTDMKATGNIVTSNERVNRLISNILWGQRDNFVDIPSDCPQRSERLGWTGDINAFLTTAAYNYDIRAFMKKWLADCRNDQYENGEMPHIVPNITGIMPKGTPESTSAAMWSDSIVYIPYKLYRHYGDKSFLTENYTAMQKLIASRKKNFENGLIVRGFEYGDWLAMDGNALAGTQTSGAADKYFIANVMHLNSLKAVAEVAKVLGKENDYIEYTRRYKTHLTAFQNEYFTKSGRLAFDNITSQVLALYFGVVPEKHRKRLAADLNENVIKYDYRTVTGFIGTPFLLFALADNGYMETACKVLMNNGFPGWLYEVDMGATTVWERWNTLTPDGKPNPDGMNSCNHYAYGSVMEFIYRRICGIEQTDIGFKKVKIAPNPCKGIISVCGEYESISGKIKAGYEYKDGKIRFFVEIPEGIEAELCVPGEGCVVAGSGNLETVREWENIDVMPFNDDSSLSEIFSNPKGENAFMETFGKIFHPLETAYLKVCTEKVKFVREYLLDRNRATDESFDEMLEKLNEKFLK